MAATARGDARPPATGGTSSEPPGWRLPIRLTGFESEGLVGDGEIEKLEGISLCAADAQGMSAGLQLESSNEISPAAIALLSEEEHVPHRMRGPKTHARHLELAAVERHVRAREPVWPLHPREQPVGATLLELELELAHLVLFPAHGGRSKVRRVDRAGAVRHRTLRRREVRALAVNRHAARQPVGGLHEECRTPEPAVPHLPGNERDGESVRPLPENALRRRHGKPVCVEVLPDAERQGARRLGGERDRRRRGRVSRHPDALDHARVEDERKVAHGILRGPVPGDLAGGEDVVVPQVHARLVTGRRTESLLAEPVSPDSGIRREPVRVERGGLDARVRPAELVAARREQIVEHVHRRDHASLDRDLGDRGLEAVLEAADVLHAAVELNAVVVCVDAEVAVDVGVAVEPAALAEVVAPLNRVVPAVQV